MTARLRSALQRAASHPMTTDVLRATAIAILVSVGAAAALGGGHPSRPAAPADATPDAYRQECGGCHVAYPARLLPAASWRRLLDDLPHHFGTDASLDPSAREAIAGWLASHAAVGKRAHDPPPGDRITRSAWFLHEHDEVPSGTWKRAAVKSPSNCSACHAQAERGDFDEHRVRIPG